MITKFSVMWILLQNNEFSYSNQSIVEIFQT